MFTRSRIGALATSVAVGVLTLSPAAIGPRSASAQSLTQGTITQPLVIAESNGTPYTGRVDLRLHLFTARTGGTRLGNFVQLNNVQCVNGIVTPTVNFPSSAFDGSARFIQVNWRPTGTNQTFRLTTERTAVLVSGYSQFNFGGNGGAQGPAGPAGPQGPAGAQGEPGPPGTSLNPLRLSTLRNVALESGPAFRISFGSLTLPGFPCTDGEDLYVPLSLSGTVVQINGRTGRTITTHTTGSQPRQCAYDGTRVWVSTATGVSRINQNVDPATVTDFNVGAGNSWIAFAGGYVWVCSPTNNRVYALNSVNGNVLSRSWAVQSPGGIAPDSGGVWVSSATSGDVVRLVATDDDPVATVNTGGNPGPICVVGSVIYVGDTQTNAVYSFANNGQGTITTRGVVSPTTSLVYDGQFLYAMFNTGILQAYRLPDFADAGSVDVGTGGIAAVFDGRSVWGVNLQGGFIEKR